MPARAYATRDARLRLHQQRFKLDVMRAYRHRCAICSLRERALVVQAAHIVPDVDPEGIAAVVNGLAMGAIHHLAFDRNLLGIDPGGVVHIAGLVLRESDGPMLRTGLQGFHGEAILVPRRPADRPDPKPTRVALRAHCVRNRLTHTCDDRRRVYSRRSCRWIRRSSAMAASTAATSGRTSLRAGSIWSRSSRSW